MSAAPDEKQAAIRALHDAHRAADRARSAALLVDGLEAFCPLWREYLDACELVALAEQRVRDVAPEWFLDVPFP